MSPKIQLEQLALQAVDTSHMSTGRIDIKGEVGAESKTEIVYRITKNLSVETYIKIAIPNNRVVRGKGGKFTTVKIINLRNSNSKEIKEYIKHLRNSKIIRTKGYITFTDIHLKNYNIINKVNKPLIFVLLITSIMLGVEDIKKLSDGITTLIKEM